MWKTSAFLGLGSLAIAMASLLYCQFFANSEKPNTIYFLGHTWDVPWEITLPSALFGVAAIVGGAALDRRRDRAIAGHGFDVV